ncbi:MAG TPA: HlyD family secretion protein [Bryobacteraceae bacterium]|jgi:membrane fusion protein (multidrug efflux system)
MTHEVETESEVDQEKPVQEKKAPPASRPGASPVEKGHNATRWIAGFVVLLIAVSGYLWWQHSQGFESTDDAQIEGHLDSVSSRIAGTVTYINPAIENNQFVKAGTLLLELDPRDYQADLASAQATLSARNAEQRTAQSAIPIANANAFGQLRAAEAAKAQSEANVETEQANLIAAQHALERDQAIYARAERDRVRYQALVEKQEISRSDYDARATEAATAAQSVESDRAAIQSTEQKIEQAKNVVVQRQALIDAANSAPEQVTNAKTKSQAASGQVEQAQTAIDTIKLNLTYTKIYAPASGIIGRKTVEIGNRVQPGQGLMVIVPVDDIWITANFKETQMKHMHPGQPVSIHVDSFDRDYQGHVESMPGAAGPLFSLFPPENSTGNYVKVVQRFPVRIRLNQDQDPQHTLRPGMSAEPTVTVR